MRKFLNREYHLVAKTKDHFKIFKEKQIRYTEDILSFDKFNSSGNIPNSTYYLKVVDNYMSDLSLLDGRMLIELDDNVAMMFGVMRKIEGDDFEVMLIVDGEEDFFSGEITSMIKKKPVAEFEGGSYSNFFVRATNSMEEILSKSLREVKI